MDAKVVKTKGTRNAALLRLEKETVAKMEKLGNTYILLDVSLCSIAEYFYELCRILASP